MNKFGLNLFLSLGILHLSIYPQSRENGAIQGKVTADTGEVLPGAEVKLSSPNLIGGDQFVEIDKSGRFRFVVLPTGEYSVTVTLEGLTPEKVEDIRLHPGETSKVLVSALEDAGYIYTPFTDRAEEDYKLIQKALANTEKSGFSIDCHALGDGGGSPITVGPSIAPFRQDRLI
jgi:hypothetical protein